MTTIVRFFIYTLLLNSLSVYASDSLRFIGDVNFPTGEKFQDTEIGGLSGITYDPATKKLLAISDDKSQVNETRFYEFDLTLTEKSFTVKPFSVVKLKDKDGKFFKLGFADFEGIAFYEKDILASTEGLTNKEEPTVSELYRFKRNGDFVSLLQVPEKFLPSKTNKEYGARDNKSFEALSSTLDGKTTFVGAEEALLQDGITSTTSYGSRVRIILYKDLKPVKEVAYALEKVSPGKTPEENTGDNGLVDIAAVDAKNFYSLERSYLPSLGKNVIRIFKCRITDKTTDISKMDSLKTHEFTTVEKTLMADLDDYLPLMNPSKLDNLEGIVLGPVLANGKRTLIIVSDNNFSPGQRTLFMAFEIK